MGSLTWVEYDRWNSVLAEQLFGEGGADLPVYLDVDQGVLEQCAKAVGVEGAQAQASLVAAVRSTLGLDDPVSGRVLREHVERFLKWRRTSARLTGRLSKGVEVASEPPPVVALLSILVLAAERMGADGNQAAHAYYPRLAEVLGLSEEESRRLKQRFPITEVFWRGLNEYLEANEGRLGLPTAYALGHRYVGIPQSQALVRAGDRAKLPSFFRQCGLAAGSELIPADLERLLDGWIPTAVPPVSANLRRLWRSSSARERIAGVVAVELVHWDGSVRALEGAPALKGDLSVTALVRQQFGGRSLELSLAARFPTVSETAAVRVVSAEGTPSVGVVPAAGGRVRPAPGTRLDPGSLVGAILELESEPSGERVSRRPRRVVPLRRDELLGTYIEVDRVQLADDSILIVKDDARLLDEVLDLLDKHGHRGQVYSGSAGADRTPMPGVPDGWVVLDDVQLYAVPHEVKRIDLQVLVPLTTAQLSLSGGLKLPGRIRKWSSLHPPEVRAAVAEAERLSVVLSELGEERMVLESWTVDAPALVQPLEGLELADGDYEIELFVNEEPKPISATTLRMRSADTPDVVSWETCTRLNYDLAQSSLGTLSASEAIDVSARIVDGLNAVGTWEPEVATHQVSSGIRWSTRKSSRGAQAPVVVLGQADPKSCVVTGAHYMEVDEKPTHGRYLSACRDCGVAKSYPARPKWKKASQAQNHASTSRFVDLPSHAQGAVGWDECLDALIHVGGGNIGSLERVATQAEGSSLFVDDFLRTLELLGHIDVRRDAALQPVEWEANPAYLAEMPNGEFVLAGVWSSGTRKQLSRALSAVGGVLENVPSDHRLSAWVVRGVDARQLGEAAGGLPMPAYVIENAVESMLSVLPPLGEVEAALPTIPLPDYQKASIFDLAGASWQPSPGVGAPGAYRLEQSFRRVSVWVDGENAVRRQARVGSVQLVKHLAARAAKRPLIGYLESSRTLVVPMGADLPGLYGRAVALCSGRSPQLSVRTRSIGYPDTPRWVADRLYSLFLV